MHIVSYISLFILDFILVPYIPLIDANVTGRAWPLLLRPNNTLERTCWVINSSSITDFSSADLGTRWTVLRLARSCVLSVVHRYYIDLPVSGLYSAACFSAVPSGPSPRDHRSPVSSLTRIAIRISRLRSLWKPSQWLLLYNVDFDSFFGYTILGEPPLVARHFIARTMHY